MSEENNNPTTLPLLQLKHVQGDGYKLKETTIHDVVKKLEQAIFNSCNCDKPALVTESLVLSLEGVDRYNRLTARINIIPGDKVDLFLKENTVKGEK